MRDILKRELEGVIASQIIVLHAQVGLLVGTDDITLFLSASPACAILVTTNVGPRHLLHTHQ